MAREQDCTPGILRGRLTKARTFSEAANLIAGLVEGEHDLADAVVTLHIHTGIAAADVICCARLGRHSTGEDHHQAIELLKRADQEAAEPLRRLLQLKTPVGYGHRLVSRDDRLRAQRAADKLIQRAEELAG